MSKSEEQLDREAMEETAYFDMLYNFSCVVSKANEKSFDGYEPGKIAQYLKKSKTAFCKLCMIDDLGERATETKVQPEKKQEPEQKRVPEKKMDPVKEKEPLPDNFLKINADGWGLCPKCGSKVLRVTATTRLENYPVYCKRCRAEHLVNWWNAESLRINYSRYVHTNPDRIRDQALKGNGYRNFMNTGSSSTERVAVKYS